MSANILYEANMSEKHRALPSWMEKKKEKVKEKVKEAPLMRNCRRRKTTRAAFYCMNEKELVEAAVSYLTNEGAVLLPDHQDEDKARDTVVKTKEKPAATIASESSDCGDAPETTYVSETDEDVTEVETVPYTTNPQRPGGQRSRPAQDDDVLQHVGQKEEEKEENSQTPAEAAEDDDDLRLVREIFFT